jgi:8-oxo-dGTP pyrophosphatase MutT (NUDIX family)
MGIMNDRLACHITVAAVIERDGRFLFVEESDAGRRVLNQPAGHLDAGEDLLEAVVREVREETCLDFAPDATLGCDLLELANGAVVLRVIFCGSVSMPADAGPRDPAIHALHWLTPAQAEANWRMRSPLVLRSIRRYLHEARLPLAAVGALMRSGDS